MKTDLPKSLIGSIAALSLVGNAPGVVAQALPYNTARLNTYECVTLNGKPNTVVNTPRGTISLIVWQSGFFSTSGWTPERRCQEVSKRFQQHENTGELRYISTGTLNGYNIICVAEKIESSTGSPSYLCQNHGIILTLENKDDPNKVMRELFNLTARTSEGPITRGSRPTTAAIDLEDFLQKAETVEEISAASEDKTTANSQNPPPTQEKKTGSENSLPENHLDLCSDKNPMCRGNQNQ
jgi:hypothetical protein